MLIKGLVLTVLDSMIARPLAEAEIVASDEGRVKPERGHALVFSPQILIPQLNAN